MPGIYAYEMMIGFVIMNAFIVLGVYGIKQIITLKYELNGVKEMLNRDRFNFLKQQLAEGELNRPEFDDLRLYVLNNQLAHGEIGRPEYEDLHHRFVH